MNLPTTPIVCLALLLLTSQCNSSFSSVMQRGSVESAPFDVSVDFEYTYGLMIVPVEIEGTTYRFLWDTGAATAITPALRQKFGYPIIRKGQTQDSQKIKTSAVYVAMEEFSMGGVSFYDQGAIVIRLDLHPVLRCLKLDGIIGGNTIRRCRWTLDYQNKTLAFSNQPGPGPQPDDFVATFDYDGQYDMIINLGLDASKASGLTFDTGSNGGVTLPHRLYTQWLELGIADSVYVNSGYRQSGFLGQARPEQTRYAYVDSLTYGTFLARDVEVESGNSALVGNEVWSQFRLTIDWGRQQIYGQYVRRPEVPDSWGMGISVQDGQPFVLRIQEGGEAQSQGVYPLQKVLAIGSVDFQQGGTFCEYLETFAFEDYPADTVRLVTQDSLGEVNRYLLSKRSLW